MVASISDHDQRQYARMREAITAVNNGPLSLDALHAVTATLEFLVRALEAKGTEWERRFYQKWGGLEDVYAVALDEGLREIPPVNIDLVKNAFAGIQDLLPAGCEDDKA